MERIAERKKDIRTEKEINEDICIGYFLSPFQQELFEKVRKIFKKAGVSFRNFCEISKYPELVDKVLIELESKKRK